jgi:hypothetical protein
LRFPRRLVTNGLLAKLWREAGTRRGGGVVTSLLPVLALDTWPGQEGAEKEWTGPTHVPNQRLATLAGLSRDSVTAACRRLVERRLMTLKRRPRARHEGGYKLYYRLSTKLYPQAGEPYAAVPGNLIYGGVWSLLPSAACRHLYLVIAGLDPIGDEEAYLDAIEADLDGDWDHRADDDDWDIADPAERAAAVQAKLLAEQRARHPLSMRDLVESSGLQPSTVVKALQRLLAPIFGDRVDERREHPSIALLKQGEPQPGQPTWYAPDRRAWDWSVKCEVMNSPMRLQMMRDRVWIGSKDGAWRHHWRTSPSSARRTGRATRRGTRLASNLMS